jgi:PAS domain S-box-containing protein
MVQSTRHTSSWPVGPGEMAECIRRHDWAATALGPLAGWPPHLRTAVDIGLASPVPTAIVWGEQRLQLYNDAYRAIAQHRHPAILGRPMLENWPEAQDLIGPMLDRVFATGEPIQVENRLMPLNDANGVPAERFFSFTFSAIRDRYGLVAGVLHTAVETTAGFHAEHRLRELLGGAGLSVDFRALFQTAPVPLLLLAPPDFHIVAANDASLRASGTSHDALLGRPIFELFASTPGRTLDPAMLRDSLERVIARRAPDNLPMMAQDGAPDVGDQRWWNVINTPVLDAHGEVALIIHRAEDVTELARLRQSGMAGVPLADGASCGPAPAQALDADEPRVPRFLAALLDSVSDYVYAFDAQCRITYVNRAMRQLFGPTSGDPVGKTLAGLGYPPELARRLQGHIRHILDTGEPVEDEIYFTGPRGVRAYFQFMWAPVRDAGGHIAQVVGVSRDTTERRRMEERLRQGEARQSFLLALGDRVREITDATLIVATISEMVGNHLGVGRCGYGEVSDGGHYLAVERDWTDGAMPSLAGRTRLADFGPQVVAQHLAGQTVVLDDTLEDARTRGAEPAYAGAGHVRASVTVPLFKDDRFVALFYVQQNRPRHWRDEEVALLGEAAERTWSAVVRARAERALRESERRYRTLFDAIDEGFCLIEKVDTSPGQPSDYRYLAVNPAFVAHTGIKGAIGRSLRQVFPEGSSFWCDTFDRIVGSGEAFRFEHGLVAHGRVFDVYACRLDDDVQARVAVLFSDITERKQHEQHQRLLLNELNHRVKNTLVTVQSMAMQSFRPGVEPALARERFEGRLMALSRAHDILTRESWGGAPLADIVRDALAPYRDLHHDRLRTDGPPLWLQPRHALAFAMVLHELCTNAIKYGALSTPQGQVQIDWGATEGMLWLRWVESGGPRVLPPIRRGFGSRLIEQGLRHEIGGSVAFDFAPGGLTCTIKVSLAELGRPARFG